MRFLCAIYYMYVQGMTHKYNGFYTTYKIIVMCGKKTGMNYKVDVDIF